MEIAGSRQFVSETRDTKRVNSAWPANSCDEGHLVNNVSDAPPSDLAQPGTSGIPYGRTWEEVNIQNTYGTAFVCTRR